MQSLIPYPLTPVGLGILRLLRFNPNNPNNLNPKCLRGVGLIGQERGQGVLGGRRGRAPSMLLAGYPLTIGQQDRGSSWKTLPVKGNPQRHFSSVNFQVVIGKAAGS